MNPRLDKGQIEVVDLRVAEVLRRKSSSDRIAILRDILPHLLVIS